MPTTPPILKVANAQGFWGDDPTAPLRLTQQQPDLDVLTLDYLAEVSMSILAKQRSTDPSTGYARDFLDVVRDLAQLWRSGRKLKLITNAGGLNPAACAAAAVAALREAGAGNLRVGVVNGDDVLDQLKNARVAKAFEHLETHRPLADIADRLVTASAYIGAQPIVEALRGGADIVITGRVADPSLTVGPAAFHFGWAANDFSHLAGATIAGHLIECGTQVTGGIATDWLDITAKDPRPIGFPIVEIDAAAACLVTKPAGTGGRVDERTVKEQLLYELGDPAKYLSPDATVNFLTTKVAELAPDRVSVSGAAGSAPPATYKVSATYRAGWRSAGTLLLGGADARVKAERAARRLLDSLQSDGLAPADSLIEVIGGDGAEAALGPNCAVRIAVADNRRDVVEAFSRRLMSLVTAGPQGVTGYADGRPPVREVFGYWPCLIDRGLVHPRVQIMEV